jgi:hypothetical protein
MTNEYLFIIATRFESHLYLFLGRSKFPQYLRDIRYHFQNKYSILRGGCIIIVSYHNHFNLTAWTQQHVL